MGIALRNPAIGPRFGSFIPTGATPRVNFAHPITKDLKGVWVPGITGAASYNLVDGAVFSNQDPTNFTRVGGTRGAAYNGTSTASSAAFKGAAGATYLSQRANQWTIFSLAKITLGGASPGGARGASLYGERALSGNNIIKLSWDSAADQIFIVIRDDPGNLVQIGSSVGQSDGLFHTWTGTKNGNGGSTNVILYKDAIVSNTGNWIGTDTFTNASLLSAIGYDPQDTTGNFFGDIALSAIWTRVLSQTEIAQLDNDPWCFLTFPGESLSLIISILVPLRAQIWM